MMLQQPDPNVAVAQALGLHELEILAAFFIHFRSFTLLRLLGSGTRRISFGRGNVG